MPALARLDTWLLVGTDDHVVGVQWDPLPHSLAQIEHRPGILFEPWVTWEDPVAELPGPNGILIEPPPDGGATDLGDDAPADSFAGDFRVGVPGRWQATLARQLASERFDLDDDVRGRRTVVRVGHDPASRADAARRTVYARCTSGSWAAHDDRDAGDHAAYAAAVAALRPLPAKNYPERRQRLCCHYARISGDRRLRIDSETYSNPRWCKGIQYPWTVIPRYEVPPRLVGEPSGTACPAARRSLEHGSQPGTVAPEKLRGWIERSACPALQRAELTN